jgi:hypothetical protein
MSDFYCDPEDYPIETELANRGFGSSEPIEETRIMTLQQLATMVGYVDGRELQDKIARLTAALANIKMAGGDDCYYCPVCEGESFHVSCARGEPTPEDVVHAPDCQRQVALGIKWTT